MCGIAILSFLKIIAIYDIATLYGFSYLAAYLTSGAANTTMVEVQNRDCTIGSLKARRVNVSFVLWACRRVREEHQLINIRHLNRI